MGSGKEWSGLPILDKTSYNVNTDYIGYDINFLCVHSVLNMATFSMRSDWLAITYIVHPEYGPRTVCVTVNSLQHNVSY